MDDDACRAHQDLLGLFDAAAAAAMPDGKFAGCLPEPPRGRTIVIGAGKAAARMAAAFEDAWKQPCEGIVATRHGPGRSGRNAEFLLSMAYHLREQGGVSAPACDTDGIDGSEDNASAWFHLPRPVPGLNDALSYLMANDAYSCFSERKQLVVTGPTRTNVNDFRAVILR